MLKTNPCVMATEAPPIAEAAGWLRPDNFGATTPLLDVCQAVPGYGPDEALRDHVAKVAQDPDSAFYTDIEGIPELRSALAAEMSGFYKGKIASDDVLVTAGCNQAFMIVIMTLAKAGDSVILPTPWYFNHKMTLDMLGIEAIALPCQAENGMLPDLEQAEALIKDNTRAIVLVSPNNPTGAIYPAELLTSFTSMVTRCGIGLIVDETYRDFLPLAMDRPHDLFRDAGWRQSNLIHLYSFSKVFSLTGYRVGAMVADPAFIAEAAKVMDCMAICAPSLGQHGALYGVQSLQSWRMDKRQLMADRVTAFKDAMETSNSGYKIRSMGAYFAYMEHPFSDQGSKEVAQRLAGEHNLLCLPGSMFGPGQERMLRFAFANVEASTMPIIAKRLVNP